MTKELEIQKIELLKKYNIDNCIIVNEQMTINGTLDLRALTLCDKDFLKGTTINGNLYLESLTSCDKDFLKGNVAQLQSGYNKEKKYCFFDNILSKVNSISIKKGYTIYTTPFEFIIQKGDYTAHANNIKKGIQDLEFKIISEKLKHEPINCDTLITVKHYHLLTGACDNGIRNWMQSYNIEFKIVDGKTVEVNPIVAKELYAILEKSNAYGFEKFKKLVTF